MTDRNQLSENEAWEDLNDDLNGSHDLRDDSVSHDQSESHDRSEPHSGTFSDADSRGSVTPVMPRLSVGNDAVLDISLEDGEILLSAGEEEDDDNVGDEVEDMTEESEHDKNKHETNKNIDEKSDRDGASEKSNNHTYRFKSRGKVERSKSPVNSRPGSRGKRHRSPSSERFQSKRHKSRSTDRFQSKRRRSQSTERFQSKNRRSRSKERFQSKRRRSPSADGSDSKHVRSQSNDRSKREAQKPRQQRSRSKQLGDVTERLGRSRDKPERSGHSSSSRGTEVRKVEDRFKSEHEVFSETVKNSSSTTSAAKREDRFRSKSSPSRDDLQSLEYRGSANRTSRHPTTEPNRKRVTSGEGGSHYTRSRSKSKERQLHRRYAHIAFNQGVYTQYDVP